MSFEAVLFINVLNILFVLLPEILSLYLNESVKFFIKLNWVFEKNGLCSLCKISQLFAFWFVHFLRIFV